MKNINLEEIINKYCNLTDDNLIQVKDAMLEFGTELLVLATENAIENFWGMYDYHGDHDCFKLDEDGAHVTSFTDEDGKDVDVSIHFDKQSILDTIKQII